jgi:arylformamidase
MPNVPAVSYNGPMSINRFEAPQPFRRVSGRIACMEDVSARLAPGMPVWPGDPPFGLAVASHLDRGDSATVHRLTLSTHTGTHVDAPAHFIRGGAPVAELPWEGLIGPAVMVDTGDAPLITAAVLDALVGVPDVPILLLKTANSHRRLWADPVFRQDFVALDAGAATWLVAHGVRGVGIDYLSIEPFGSGTKGHPAHLALLAARVVIVEGLDLTHATVGRGLFICLPLAVGDAEGAPARAVWIPEGPGG